MGRYCGGNEGTREESRSLAELGRFAISDRGASCRYRVVGSLVSDECEMVHQEAGSRKNFKKISNFL